MTLYRQKTGKRDQVLLHLLNATGSVIEAGEVVPRTTPQDAYRPLGEDIAFEIKLPAALSRAYVVSPDFEGRRPVRVSAAGDRHSVVVHRRDLTWFSTVYFDLRTGPSPD